MNRYEMNSFVGCCPACGSEVRYKPLSAHTSEASCLCGCLLLRYEGGGGWHEGTVEIIAPRRSRRSPLCGRAAAV